MWILIVFAFSGGLSSSDSVALTSIDTFNSEETCTVAGDKIKRMESGTLKTIKYTCVRK